MPREVGALGNVRAEHAVGALLGSALPGAVGIGEADLQDGADARWGVWGRLRAVGSIRGLDPWASSGPWDVAVPRGRSAACSSAGFRDAAGRVGGPDPASRPPGARRQSRAAPAVDSLLPAPAGVGSGGRTHPFHGVWPVPSSCSQWEGPECATARSRPSRVIPTVGTTNPAPRTYSPHGQGPVHLPRTWWWGWSVRRGACGGRVVVRACACHDSGGGAVVVRWR